MAHANAQHMGKMSERFKPLCHADKGRLTLPWW
jgi:hypothetical protein